jgi:hypothetical protein
MRALTLVLSLFPSLLLPAVLCNAQCTSGESVCNQAVPHLMKVNGVLKDAAGQPRTGVVGVTFSIYRESSGGAPLWQEIQNVQLDQGGHYEVLLGAAKTEGVPLELFTSREPRWLGMQAQLPGEEEQPRALLVSAPYALKAGDAETLGGLPPSAFVKVAPRSAGQTTTVSNATVAIPAPQAAIVAPATVGTGSSPGEFQTTRTLGTLSPPSLSNILFADRFPGGVPDAVKACPVKGCVIYAVSPNVNLNLGSIDPGSKVITLYLGPFTYSVKQITLRSGLRILGMGASAAPSGSDPGCSTAAPCNGTTLQSVNGNNPVFVIPRVNNRAAIDVLISGFRLLGSVGNTNEDAILLDASSLSNAGLWYSTFKDIQIFNFSGIGVHLKGTTDGFEAMNQWVRFDRVVVFRNPGGGNGLRIEGAAFELDFQDCQFDGRTEGDGTNIYIGGLAGGIDGFPITINFRGLVSQLAGTAVQLDGAEGISFYGSHHEKVWGVYRITGNMNIWNIGVTISDTWFNTDVGAHAGSGFLLNVATTLASGIRFVHNEIFGSPDSVVSGTNLAQIVYRDNQYQGSATVPPTSGITTQLAPAASINIGGVHSIGLNPSTTPITTIQSSLGPGEMATFFTFAGPVAFASGGNINLMGLSSLTINGSITFVRNDLTGTLQWTPVAQWTAP